MSFTYEYARPALTSDCVVFGLDQDGLKILLIQRALPPFENQWALSGGFIHIDDCARRELQEETGLKNICLEQLATIGTPDRDPHEHVVTVAHFALVNSSSIPPPPPGSPSMTSRPSPSITAKSSSSPASASVEKSATNPIGFELLPKKFTLTQLQHLYELILEQPFDKRNFRKKVIKLGILAETNEVEKDVARRAARLYRFDRSQYRKLQKQGLDFEL